MVNPCAKSIWKHACSHWACFPRLFTMAKRQVWERDWFVMAHDQVYLYCWDGQFAVMFVLRGFCFCSVTITHQPVHLCYILMFGCVCGNGSLLEFGCDCRGTMHVYFQKWMKTKTWDCVIVDQIVGGYKRWMNVGVWTQTPTASFHPVTSSSSHDSLLYSHPVTELDWSGRYWLHSPSLLGFHF